MEQQKMSIQSNRSILEEKEYKFCEEFNSKWDGQYGRLTGIRVRAGAVIDAIRFDYDGDSSKELYGGEGGTFSEFKFEDGEFIKMLDFTMGLYGNFPVPVVCFMYVKTNKGRIFKAGTEGKCKDEQRFTFAEEEGKCWHTFQGKYAKYLIDLPRASCRMEGEYRFDDAAFAQDKSRITEIRLYTGWVVDGIQIIYDGDQKTPIHGSKTDTYKSIKLSDGEYITSIEGATGNYMYQGPNTLCRLTIKTNMGRSVTGGTGQACSELKEFCYKAEADEQIFAIAGKYRGYMNSVEVGMYAGKNEVPEQGNEKQFAAKIELLSSVGIKESLDSGCYTQEELKNMWKSTVAATVDGSTTNTALRMKKDSILESKATKKEINKSIYVFRSVAASEELKLIKAKRQVVSKAQRANVFDEPIISIEKQNTSQKDYAFILRILATKASNTPLSQFASHAFNFETAKKFGDVMVAYKVVPNSPFLGLHGTMKVGKGEDQLQILGGTDITDLYIYKNKKWYLIDSQGNEIRITEGKRPVNYEYKKLLTGEEEEEREL